MKKFSLNYRRLLRKFYLILGTAVLSSFLTGCDPPPMNSYGMPPGGEPPPPPPRQVEKDVEQ